MKRPFILFFFLSLSLFSLAQPLRIGIFGGIANYQGDLVDKLYVRPKPAVGLTVSYDVNRRIAIRAGLTYGRIAGADSLSDKDYLRARNLSFESPVTELSVLGEFNTFDLDVKRWTPFVFAGLGIYHYNPYTYDRNNEKVYLKPLSTEGQGLPGYNKDNYSLYQLALPFGGGIKFAVSDRVRISAEIGLRKLFTDYLDDISENYAAESDLLDSRGPQAADLAYRGDETATGSPTYPEKGSQRGSPKYKDYYYFTGLHVSLALGDGSGNGRKGKFYSCPKVF
jgi:hypothetical protein